MTERTILIVDSKKVLFETVRDYFARSNLLCTVLWSGSEADALQTVLKTDVNIIYADHGSPGAVDGLEIIRAIRQEQLPIRVILGDITPTPPPLELTRRRNSASEGRSPPPGL